MSEISFADSRIEDTFAEAFEMKYTRVIITAINSQWLEIAAREFCGYGTSVIGCDAEVAIETNLPAEDTPDGRAGLAILAFGFSTEELAKAVVNRAGQCLMTCPTTAVFNGGPSDKRIPVGKHLRFFGDGFQKSKELGGRRFWRIPVMDGEFICEDELGFAKGIAGGNFILQTREQAAGLAAALAAVQAIQEIAGCITPFPGGIARSGSKVGSRYQNQIASTAEAYCPTLRGRVATQLHPNANCAYEVVLDAIDEATVRRAMRAGIEAAFAQDKHGEVLRVSAGNYGGKLGKCIVPLKSL
ncbi:MAG: formylmethanofuran--tetrahydromethanopterin N-formyltransferase [Planctomycetaceae bacterium]|nr:formylmethanofuran--tetrahydromethanopterin N-formyltransferase [Planctomycetaceae bacterium]